MTKFATEHPDTPIVIKAIALTPNIVRIAIVDKAGDIVPSGNLLTIHSNGSVERHAGISRKFGFDLDDDGRLPV